MYLVRSLRTFIGTNAERTAAGLSSFLAGDEFIETDTNDTYIHDGMAWRVSSERAAGSDMQLQFNDNGVFAGATALIYDKTLNDFRILGDGNSHLFMLDYSANSIGFGTNGAFGTIAMFSPTIIVYNEDGQDVDFRVEGDNFSNLFKVDAGLDAVQIGTAAAGTVADFRSTGIIFNEDSLDLDIRIEGNTATHLLVTDGGLDAVQIGTTVAGAIADFRSTAIVLNNAEADVDIRWAGSGVTNAYYYDAGNNRHGFGGVPTSDFIEAFGDVSLIKTGASTLHLYSYRESTFTHARVIGHAARGTLGTPGTTQANDFLMQFSGMGYHTTAGFSHESAYFLIRAAENFTATAQGSYFELVTTTPGTTTRVTRSTVGLGIQVASPSGGDPGAGALALDAHLNLDEMGSTPTSPSAGASCNVYMKADKLVIQFNDGGTVRYKYLDLTGTGVTWVHTTTAP